MRLIHISDTHGYHEYLKISECDVLIHSGDIGGKTTPAELMAFLVWFEKQPAHKKIFIAGNHDLCLDKNWVKREKSIDSISGLLAEQKYKDAKSLIESYDVKYLENTDYVFEGIKFYGSPYSPSFHRYKWVFNADRGEEIKKIWARIPSDTNVLITHTPVYNILDDVKEYATDGEDAHRGCKDLFDVMHKRLFNLKLHCSGHLHDEYGVVLKSVSGKRRILFSNGAILTNKGELIVKIPLTINL